MPTEEVRKLVTTAQEVEKLGMIGLLFFILVVVVLGAVYMYKSFMQCKKDMQDQATKHHEEIVNMIRQLNT